MVGLGQGEIVKGEKVVIVVLVATRMSEDSDFDSEWREEVKTKVSTCMCSSKLCEDEYLDGGIA